MLGAPIKKLRKAAFKYLNEKYDIQSSDNFTDEQPLTNTDYTSSQDLYSTMTVEEEKSLYSTPARVKKIREDCLSTVDTILTNEEIYMPIFIEILPKLANKSGEKSKYYHTLISDLDNTSVNFICNIGLASTLG